MEGKTHVTVARPSPTTASVVALARWWTSASQAERFELLKRTIEGDAQAPALKEVQLAIFLAESEAGEVSEG